jgi:bacteriocin biosynthesis cyclodehydratase domain-containing protein
MPASPAPSTPALPVRPVLKPLRRLWRDADVLQLGVEPRHAVVLAGVGAPELRLLDLLDGTRATDDVVAEAAAIGLDPGRARDLVTTLHDAGLLDEQSPAGGPGEHERQRLQPDRMSLAVRHRRPGAADRILRRRREASVQVHGAGRVGAAVATLVAAAGVGQVGCVDDGRVRLADLSPAGIPAPSAGSRAAATARRLRHAGAVPVPGPRAKSAPPAWTVTVVAPVGTMPTPQTLAAVRDRAHLLVVVRESTATVGPFVLPGHSACIRCLELTRGERDSGWPTLAAQLAWAPRAVDACDVTLATLTAAVASMHVLGWIDHDGAEPPPSVGGLVEFDLVTGRLRRRTVRPHPACGCGAAS